MLFRLELLKTEHEILQVRSERELLAWETGGCFSATASQEEIQRKRQLSQLADTLAKMLDEKLQVLHELIASLEMDAWLKES